MSDTVLSDVPKIHCAMDSWTPCDHFVSRIGTEICKMGEGLGECVVEEVREGVGEG